MQIEMFVTESRKLSACERRDLKRQIADKRREVESVTNLLLYRDVMISYFADGRAEESHTINVMGSGPPSNWRSLVRTLIDNELAERKLDPVHTDKSASLLRAARRLGRINDHQLMESCLFVRQSELRSLFEQLPSRNSRP